MSADTHLVARIANHASYAQGFAALAMGATTFYFDHLAAVPLLIFGVGHVAAKLGRRLDGAT